MFSHPRGVTGVIGAMLFLVAMYLVLEHGADGTTLIKAVAEGGSSIFKTLQGR